jgi:hypothetical protein
MNTRGENVMLEVTARRTVHEPEFQVFAVQVRVHGFDRLTPRAARAALEIAFGQSYGGEVWSDEYGYRVYENTARKVYGEETEMNANALTVRAQLPANAHLSIPANTPVEMISRHRYTRRGVFNALKSRENTAADYIRSRGNAAAFRVWIEDAAGQEIDPLDLRIEFDLRD